LLYCSVVDGIKYLLCAIVATSLPARIAAKATSLVNVGARGEFRSRRMG
jgi:hypothetical protein